MKQRILAMLLAVMLCISGVFCEGFVTRAEEIGEDIDISYLQTEDALIGYADSQTWGVYLLDGYSIINKISSGTIGAGGVTTAAKKCTVSVNAIVERLSSGSWVRVTSWTITRTDAFTAMASKSISVGSGYYYRVRCIHRASTDTSSSCTDGLWI